MYSAQDVSSLYHFDFIYFLAVVLVGNYLELNLMVAVLKTELSKATQVQRLRMWFMTCEATVISRPAMSFGSKTNLNTPFCISTDV